MNLDLQRALSRCRTLPSPPRICEEVLNLARQPEPELRDLAAILSRDPGLAARVLRIANSSLYAGRRSVANLRDALVVVGVNAAMSLALGFSMVQSLGGSAESIGRYSCFWNRALLAAHAAEAMAQELRIGMPENAFLAALVQDIGILAMAQALGGEYGMLASGDACARHDLIAATERDRYGSDHAEVGAWLLERWSFPAPMRVAVAFSHSVTPNRSNDPNAALCNCVAVSGTLADIWVGRDSTAAIEQAREMAQEWLGLSSDSLGRILEAVASRIPEARDLYGIEIVDEVTRSAIMEEASELLLLRSLHTAMQAQAYMGIAEHLVTQARVIEDQARKDPLTGIFNRRYLDTALHREFEDACRHGWPLSVVFIDLDHFKRVNDTFGHQVGDDVLISVARLLSAGARRNDIVARYGGEEFVMVLPATDSAGAINAAQRFIDRIAASHHGLAQGQAIRVTASAGLSTHSQATPFESPEALVRRADSALYRAKANGRNRVVFDLGDTPV